MLHGEDVTCVMIRIPTRILKIDLFGCHLKGVHHGLMFLGICIAYPKDSTPSGVAMS